jgi:hypothetical protein
LSKTNFRRTHFRKGKFPSRIWFAEPPALA